MCKKTMFGVMVIAMGLTGGVVFGDISSGLVGYWPLDGDAVDASGNGLDGELLGNVLPAAGMDGLPDSAMLFDGAGTSYIELGDPPALAITGALTLAAWVRIDSFADNGRIIARIGSGSRSYSLNVESETYGHVGVFQIGINGGADLLIVGTKERLDPGPDEWVHLSGTYEPGVAVKYYLNGELDNQLTQGIPLQQHIANVVRIGKSGTTWGAFSGTIDEVYVFDRALSEGDIFELCWGLRGIASDGFPAHTATDVPRDMTLSWAPGEYAVTHDVYLGTVFQDVNEADRANPMDLLLSQDLDVNSFDPGRLDFDQTYYWRVDEVNAPPDSSVYRGKVWSFTVEPVAIPIDSGTIITTASSVHTPDTGPEKTVDGSGIDEAGRHSTDLEDMWLCATTDTQPWIQFAFAKAQKLQGLEVWNHNSQTEKVLGYGIKEALLEYSLDGVTWSEFGILQLSQATGMSDYSGTEAPVSLDGIVAQYVKLSSITNWSILGLTQVGLSEVRFLGIPTNAREPQPESGTVGVDPGTVLGWRSGRLAERHEVYLGQDATDLSLAAEIAENQLDARSLGLELGATYYWRVDEVNEVETPTTWQGETWNFSTPEYRVVDDMESYVDREGQWIWETWVDGFEDPTNGSTVGHGNLPETETVYSGSKAMPLSFDNQSAALSETTRTFASAQDWTLGSPATLTLFFHGDMGNTSGQLYVKINTAKTLYEVNPAALSSPFWTQWNIDLDAMGTDLSQVHTLTIGIEGAGAQGVLIIDDLRLYSQAPASLTPQDPGTENLVAHYTLDNTAEDGSGNGHHGTVEGVPAWTSPGWNGTGACMRFGGDNDRITVESFDVTGSGITLAAWINPILFLNDARMLSKSAGSSTEDHYWAMILSGSGENFLQFRLRTDAGATTSRTSGGNALAADEWTHVAVTWDAGDPFMRQYKNGQEIDSVDKAGTAVATDAGVQIGIGNQSVSAGPDAADMTRPFEGLMDEVRVYSRGLSEAELLYLIAGL